MALYAFDGTWNTDDDDDALDTNVVKLAELYTGEKLLLAGVGTRFGGIGRVLGGLFGAGGRTRIEEMRDFLEDRFQAGDEDIDIVGFSRGAALATHFANRIAEEGVPRADGTRIVPRIRFLGLWDLVGSFGLSFDTFVDFHAINLGWDIDRIADTVDRCHHAMALDERRETFGVTRLDPEHRNDNVEERWFRGVHSDVGGGNENPARSNIALRWMLERARDAGLPLDLDAAESSPKYAAFDHNAPISENRDPRRDGRREVLDGDVVDETARPLALAVGESHRCRVLARSRNNWSRVRLEAGASYRVRVPSGDTWSDDGIVCGPDGWDSEQLPWFREHLVRLFESRRREPSANWFELIGAVGDEDDRLVRLGGAAGEGATFTADRAGELWLFANDLDSKYGNNSGDLEVTVERVG